MHAYEFNNQSQRCVPVVPSQALHKRLVDRPKYTTITRNQTSKFILEKGKGEEVKETTYFSMHFSTKIQQKVFTIDLVKL